MGVGDVDVDEVVEGNGEGIEEEVGEGEGDG